MMGGWLNELYEREGWHASVVVPVPLSDHRMRERGFNQAGLLAEAFGGRANLEVEMRQLERIEDTRSQVGLDPYERWENVKKAFSAEPGTFEGVDVLVIDDLFTTGATLSACASALRIGGAQSIVGLTVARA